MHGVSNVCCDECLKFTLNSFQDISYLQLNSLASLNFFELFSRALVPRVDLNSCMFIFHWLSAGKKFFWGETIDRCF